MRLRHGIGLVLAFAFCGCAAVPIEVTDDAGALVRLARPAQRVVSLAPSITEQLFAIGAGDRIVGTSAYSDYPAQARRIPVVAGAEGVDLERIATLHPDLIVLWGSGYAAASRDAIGRLGVPVYVSEPESLESIARSMEHLGRLTGAEQAPQQSERFRARLRELQQRYAGRAPLRVFYQIWPQPLMTLSGRHVVSEALRLCGAHNIFADAPMLVASVSPEAVIAADPQAIVAPEPGGVDHGALDFWKRYPFITAVARQQLLTVDSDRMDRATPRMLDEIAALCGRLDAARRDPGAPALSAP